MPEAEYITTNLLTKQIGNLTAIADTSDVLHITPFLPLARRDVKKIISDDTYTEYLAKEDTDEDRIIIATAESYFALAYIIPHLNKVSSGAGIVKATGFNESRNELLSESEVQRIVDGYRAQANNLLTDYRASTDTDDDDYDDSITLGKTKLFAI